VKYIVDIAGERHEVDLEGGSATLNGATASASLAEVAGTPVKLVTIGGVQHRVVARREGPKGRYVLWIDGWRFEAEALDERQRAIRDLGAAAAGAAGPAPVVAPMPGLIVRVHVAEGDEVQAGQPVAVMEAMKMENELRATAAGTVQKVLVQAGKVVEKGAVLVELA
jgi:biotin carboxyl carrier protein